MKIIITEDDGTVIDTIDVIDQECPYDGTEDTDCLYLDEEDSICQYVKVSLRNKIKQNLKSAQDTANEVIDEILAEERQ